MEEEPAAGSERGQDEEPGCSVEPATVGFVFTDKKRRSLLTPVFVSRAR